MQHETPARRGRLSSHVLRRLVGHHHAQQVDHLRAGLPLPDDALAHRHALLVRVLGHDRVHDVVGAAHRRDDASLLPSAGGADRSAHGAHAVLWQPRLRRPVGLLPADAQGVDAADRARAHVPRAARDAHVVHGRLGARHRRRHRRRRQGRGQVRLVGRACDDGVAVHRGVEAGADAAAAAGHQAGPARGAAVLQPVCVGRAAARRGRARAAQAAGRRLCADGGASARLRRAGGARLLRQLADDPHGEAHLVDLVQAHLDGQERRDRPHLGPRLPQQNLAHAGAACRDLARSRAASSRRSATR
mmetsp:Transcript_21531/g.71183  ORF Transcript_21531/g.71183 Transcript_21531/m.71183 type:complete len:303 (-) Transcript_21531:138-1046(-)